MKRFFCLSLCVLLLSSCAPNKKYEKTVFSMDTQIVMTAYGDGAEEALNKAYDEIKRIDDKFKVSNAQNTVIENDEETKKLLAVANEITKETDGAFDIRHFVGALVEVVSHLA